MRKQTRLALIEQCKRFQDFIEVCIKHPETTDRFEALMSVHDFIDSERKWYLEQEAKVQERTRALKEARKSKNFDINMRRGVYGVMSLRDFEKHWEEL